MPESAKILNKTKLFPGQAPGSWARNEEQYLGKFFSTESIPGEVFQCRVWAQLDFSEL